MSTPELLSHMAKKPEFDLRRITGTAERRVADDTAETGVPEDCLTMAVSAARDCLERSRYAAGEIDVVISCSISRTTDGRRQQFEPSFAHRIAMELGAAGAVRFDVSNACAGMMTGVLLLDRMIRAGQVRNGLVVSGEHITPIAFTAAREMEDSRDPQFASLTVGDSAAAVVVDRAADDADVIHDIELMTCSEYAELCLGMPSDRTGELAMYTDNTVMHAEDRLLLWPSFQRDRLADDGREFAGEGYDFIVQHQVGSRFVDYMNAVGEKVFGTPMPQSLSVVEEFANTATTSHFLALHQALAQRRIPKGSKILLVPAASGVVTGFLSTTVSALEV
ncbi:3-oxoacyl-[acyl-carrier-protein] synthase III C-terminal domain-containing protein [Streptomyces sp. HNM0663]|uniref:3-oxoacyl-[acyl-carrier-protein] synthase III C-terminal domain-containing protein n=1 Tax=Streptomyces chengmaiensis TaxID=3040919 RepID=A0ABT6HGM9_9ACTN|nr:3-oxoacyl-[acyl-carrier-protein] synthase III C-terminal domain-containing protein [Streptomyces chengmaiensis]MDH2387915.1 3-oxoacyl-[acyl-carrier-protein] synthase III C-terminal domain-containing protein [Streptomyces chengmaiensis]